MEKIILFLFLTVLVCGGCGAKSTFLGDYMKEQGLEGTVIIENLIGDKSYVYNKERSTSGFLPASTFKILNTLVALEASIVEDENQIIHWDGIDKGNPSWNCDQNMSTAFKSSCIWYYQELAIKIGIDRYTKYLKSTNYGNQNPGGHLDSFWLDGELRISAVQQIEFLKAVYSRQNGFSQRSYAILADLMKIKEIGTGTLYGKTGWVTRINTQIGWYVGYLRTAEEVWFFAVNYDIKVTGNEKYRELIVEEAFRQIGIF